MILHHETACFVLDPRAGGTGMAKRWAPAGFGRWAQPEAAHILGWSAGVGCTGRSSGTLDLQARAPSMRRQQLTLRILLPRPWPVKTPGPLFLAPCRLL